MSEAEHCTVCFTRPRADQQVLLGIAHRPRLSVTCGAVFSRDALCNTTIIHATDETQVLSDTCHALVGSGGYQLAWVGYAEQDEEKSVRPVAWANGESDYVETAHVTWGDDERGRGPVGTAIRTGRITVVRDIDTDPTFGPWRERAQRARSSVAGRPCRCDLVATSSAS